MPFKSSKQKRFFGACKGGNATLKCPPKRVLDEFFAADRKSKGRKRK